MGVDFPHSGNVYIDGTDIYSLNRSKAGYFQAQANRFDLSVLQSDFRTGCRENIMLPLLLMAGREDKARLNELLTTLGLMDRAKHLLNQLSGGSGGLP